MADSVVRDPRLGGDSEGDDGDGRNDPVAVGRDGGADSSAAAVTDSNPERDAEQAAEETRAEKGSLYDPTPDDTDDENPYGRLGRPVSRQSAFYRGFVTTAGVLVAVVFGLAVREAASVLVLLLIAAFLAVGLNPIVEFAIRRGIRRGWAVLGVALLVIGVLAAIVTVVGGVLRNQVVTLINDLPSLIEDLRHHKTIAHLDSKYHILSTIEQKVKNPDFLTDSFGGVFNVGLSVLTGVATTVIVFVLTLYFLAALPTLKRALYSLAPATRRERVVQLGDEILRRVGRYVIGAFLVALLAGTVSLIFLLSVGLAQYALPLAVMVALLDLVPLVGAITGATIVSIVGLANSLPIGLACIVFYLIYETLEGYVIYPRVMRSSVDVPEYVTIIAILVGGTLGGIIGALLALPIAAAMLLIIREVWVRRQDVS
ncbi:MAG: AI-2E family transporter [Jatrophihabitantaceae bacterium]